jgi:Fic family protein
MHESIYHGVKLEGSNITFPETQTILEGVNVPNATLDDIQAILNLRDAWKYLLNNISAPFDLQFACNLNSFVARNESIEWGVLRYGNVSIGGTNYRPDPPVSEDVERSLKQILGKAANATEKAINIFLYSARSQLFWDGNKRTGLLSANKLLISEGKGILSIPAEQLLEFNRRLTRFYETNDYSVIDLWMYDNCIKGIDFRRQNTIGY